MGIRVRELARMLDHTLLKPDATERDVGRLCREAAYYRFAAVCVLPCHVGLAAKELRGTGVKVATVVSFPFGADTTAVKAAAIHEAIQSGASEFDVVMNISKFLSGDFAYVDGELESLNAEAGATMSNGLDAVFKVIVETAFLSDALKRRAARIVASSGADFVKTSTGFGPGGATSEDVALLRGEAPERLAVKASGGIRTLKDALDLLEAGASRLGTSGSVKIMREAEDGGLQE